MPSTQVKAGGTTAALCAKKILPCMCNIGHTPLHIDHTVWPGLCRADTQHQLLIGTHVRVDAE
jgi:hypothetical protein